MNEADNYRDKHSTTGLLDLKQKNHKSPTRSFIVTGDLAGSECTKCFETIELGDRVRYDDEGVHHATHKAVEVQYKICDSCFLTLPCECEN